jgi:hypothetical protein
MFDGNYFYFYNRVRDSGFAEFVCLFEGVYGVCMCGVVGSYSDC